MLTQSAPYITPLTPSISNNFIARGDFFALEIDRNSRVEVEVGPSTAFPVGINFRLSLLGVFSV
jgi:hypothetical protein